MRATMMLAMVMMTMVMTMLMMMMMMTTMMISVSCHAISSSMIMIRTQHCFCRPCSSVLKGNSITVIVSVLFSVTI